MIAFFKKKKWPELSADEIIKRARILVIDDSEFYYQELFKDDGYTIEKWDDISNLQKLESGYYDIILLDIQGVGKKYSQDQGFGILKHLKQVCPAQIVIAYSNADFSLKYQDFFKMADETLAKTDDYVKFKLKVDQLLRQRFSQKFYIEKIVNFIAPYYSDSEKVRSLVLKSIKNQKKDRFMGFVRDHVDDKDTINMILQVLQVAFTIAAI